jgi:(p)ppGpp synthase/HD superfamily hydrolase
MPYINHPIEVCSILTQCDITDVETLCAAVLHDTI